MAVKKKTLAEFRKGLIERHGESIVEDLESILSGETTLLEIGEKYNISKMAASQFFERLFSKQYRAVVRDGETTDALGRRFYYKPKMSKQLLIMVDKRMYDRLKKHAKHLDGASVSSVVREAISDFLDKNMVPLALDDNSDYDTILDDVFN